MTSSEGLSPEDYKELGKEATTMYNEGRLEEAKSLYERVITGFEEIVGKDHIFTTVTVNNLAGVLKDMGKLDEAKLLYLRVYTTRQRTLGLSDMSTLNAIINLSLCFGIMINFTTTLRSFPVCRFVCKEKCVYFY